MNKSRLFFQYYLLLFLQCSTITLSDKNTIENVKKITESKIKIGRCLDKEVFQVNYTDCYNDLMEFYNNFIELEKLYLEQMEYKNKLSFEIFLLKRENSDLQKSLKELNDEKISLQNELKEISYREKKMLEDISKKNVLDFSSIIKISFISFIVGFFSRYIFKGLFFIIKQKIFPFSNIK